MNCVNQEPAAPDLHWSIQKRVHSTDWLNSAVLHQYKVLHREDIKPTVIHSTVWAVYSTNTRCKTRKIISWFQRGNVCCAPRLIMLGIFRLFSSCYCTFLALSFSSLVFCVSFSERKCFFFPSFRLEQEEKLNRVKIPHWWQFLCLFFQFKF